jgi:hypothetical protein
MQSRVEKLHGSVSGPELSAAADLFRDMLFGGHFQEFLTLRAYDFLD